MPESSHPLLQVIELSVTFGGVRAVDRASLEVHRGELVGLIGPNGAGKTTTIDALTGFVAHRGRVLLDGEELDGLRPHERARRGLVRTWQSLELFDDLSVAENCRVAAEPALALASRREAEDPTAAVDRALALVGLDGAGDRAPRELPLGHRKLLGVARALAAEPALVLLDEPAAGLDTAESGDLGERLRRVVDHGVAALLVDHDMGLVLSVCDRVYVLDFGRVIASGPPATIREDDAVIAAYLGTGAGAADPER